MSTEADHLHVSSVNQSLQETPGAVPYYQMSFRDQQIGKEAAVYVGRMKGWQGKLLNITEKFTMIECGG